MKKTTQTFSIRYQIPSPCARRRPIVSGVPPPSGLHPTPTSSSSNSPLSLPIILLGWLIDLSLLDPNVLTLYTLLPLGPSKSSVAKLMLSGLLPLGISLVLELLLVVVDPASLLPPLPSCSTATSVVIRIPLYAVTISSSLGDSLGPSAAAVDETARPARPPSMSLG